MSSAVRTDAVLKAALEYASYGWKIVPIKPGFKHPGIPDWPKLATSDEDKLIELFAGRETWGLGVRLGPESNLIDIEADCEEDEKFIHDLFDGEIPYTSSFIGSKFPHRLFRWNEEIAQFAKAVKHIGTLEFRCGAGQKGAQSVLPPTIHPDTKQPYRWLNHPSEAGVAEIPESVLIRLLNSGGEKKALLNGHAKPVAKSDRIKLYSQDVIRETLDGRDDTIFKEACNEWRLYRSVYGHAAFTQDWVHSTIYRKMWSWNRSSCSPPLDDDIIKQKVESAKSQEQKRIFDERSQTGVGLTEHGLEWNDGELWPGDWELTVILSNPPVYLLKVPAWKDLIGGEGIIELSAEAYRDANAVAHAIFAATKTVIMDDRPGAWPAIWNGSKGSKKDEKPSIRGLKAKLLDKSTKEESPTQWKRPAVVAELLAEKLAKAREREEPDQRGSPTRLPDGSIWVRWSKAWEEDVNLRRVTATELQQLSRSIGITPKDSQRYQHADKNRYRYFVLQPHHLRRLDVVRGETDQPSAS